MSEPVDQISWKTHAWADPGMVQGYAERMADTSGRILLKNRVETGLFAKYAKGNRVLDVGVGTGRASLPLARRGMSVTGIDSSQAMLDKCRELAGTTPIDLRVGDVTNMPFADASFDTVMALNTFAHFPHWQSILRECRRVVAPGGRVIFDVFSLDHDIAYARAIGKGDAYGIEHFAPAKVEEYYLRLSMEELAREASGHGFSIHAIRPYSVFFGTGGYNRFFHDTPVEGFAWDRLLSWCEADSSLYDFFVFLEEELVGNMTSEVACRAMIVLDVNDKLVSNEAWIDANRALNHRLHQGFDRETMALAGIDLEKFSRVLETHLRHAPSLYALARIMLANVPWQWPIDLSVLSAEHRAALEAVAHAGLLDRQILDAIDALRSRATGDILSRSGVSIAEALGYDWMMAMVEATAR